MLATWGCTTFPKPTLSLDFLGATSLDSGITFSRGSQATLFDSTGTLVYAKHNLLLQSQEFNNVAWTKSNTTVTQDASVAPNGGITADQLIEAATTTTHFLNSSGSTMGISIVSGMTYSFTIFVKKGLLASAPSWVQIAFSASQFPSGYANFNLDTGAYGTTSAVTVIPAQNVGNGWYRIGITVTATSSFSASNAVIVAFTNNDDSLGRLPSYTGQRLRMF
jgi:hypothetical protein